MVASQQEAVAAPAGVDPRVERMLHALGDENRLRIVMALKLGERCVCHLTEELRLGQSLLSHHLRVLRMAGLVSDRKDGRWVHYSLTMDALDVLVDFFSELRTTADSDVPSAC